MAGNSGTPGRSVTSKVVALLDAFGADRPQLTLSELCRRTGLPPATAHRLVGELVQWGGLERCAAGGYRIGLRLYEVGALAPRGPLLRESALPFLEDLYEATHENVQLAVLDGTEAVCVERITGHSAVRSSPGSAAGCRCTPPASGRCCWRTPATRGCSTACVDAGLTAYTPQTVVQPQRLRQLLAEIRRAGVAVGREQLTPGATSVAVPVLGPQRQVVAALSIVLPATADVGPLVPALRAASSGISRALGLRPAAAPPAGPAVRLAVPPPAARRPGERLVSGAGRG